MTAIGIIIRPQQYQRTDGPEHPPVSRDRPTLTVITGPVNVITGPDPAMTLTGTCHDVGAAIFAHMGLDPRIGPHRNRHGRARPERHRTFNVITPLQHRQSGPRNR